MTEIDTAPTTRSSSAGFASEIDELARYLVPPGDGVFAVSTGKAEREAARRAYLGANEAADWAQQLRAAMGADVALLAIPSDCGAGIVRGAAHGPEAIRAAFGQAPVADLGDVFCIPHLLSDESLAQSQIERCQDELYADVELAQRRGMPVSPLSIAARVMQLLGSVSPTTKPMVLGGDHSVTWPVIDAIMDRDPDLSQFGILHFDAHTDLSPQRLGIDICFATWAHHARLRLGPNIADGARLLQIGIRASARTREHWETSTGVRQIWAEQALKLTPSELAEQVIEHFRETGVRRIYLSNDIDGTDAYHAAACGTPEPGGLTPEHVLAVLEALHRSDLRVVGADLVEVAPGLSLDPAAAQRTVETAVRYVRASLALLAED